MLGMLGTMRLFEKSVKFPIRDRTEEKKFTLARGRFRQRASVG